MGTSTFKYLAQGHKHAGRSGARTHNIHDGLVIMSPQCTFPLDHPCFLPIYIVFVTSSPLHRFCFFVGFFCLFSFCFVFCVIVLFVLFVRFFFVFFLFCFVFFLFCFVFVLFLFCLFLFLFVFVFGSFHGYVLWPKFDNFSLLIDHRSYNKQAINNFVIDVWSTVGG